MPKVVLIYCFIHNYIKYTFTAYFCHIKLFWEGCKQLQKIRKQMDADHLKFVVCAACRLQSSSFVRKEMGFLCKIMGVVVVVVVVLVMVVIVVVVIVVVVMGVDLSMQPEASKGL